MGIEHKLLKISSHDRDTSSASTSDFVVILNNLTGVQGIKSVVVKHISIPNVFYNINAYNNTFTYNTGGAPIEVSIAEGQYTSTTFITAFETALAAVGMSVTLNAITSKFSFTTTTAITFQDDLTNSMAGVLGILRGQGAVSPTTSYTSGGVISLQGVQNVFLECTELAHSNLLHSDERVTNSLCVIPINAPYGFTEHYVSSHTEIDDFDSHSKIQGMNIQKLTITLKDYKNNVLDLHGQHVMLTLKVYF